LQWLGEEIRDHLESRTIFHTHLTTRNAVSNEEISYVNTVCRVRLPLERRPLRSKRMAL
jgi:hypothetical protein